MNYRLVGAGSNMRIVFLTSSMEGGGAERVAALLANGWADKGHEVVLMPTFSARGECVYPLRQSVDLTFLSDLCSPGAGRLERFIVLRKFMKMSRPDVVVSFLPHVNVAAILAAASLAIPVVACERTYPPAVRPQISIFYRIMRNLAYPLASALVGQTESTANWLRLRSGKAQVVAIPNPVVLPLPSKLPIIDPENMIRSERKVILWAGRFDEAKRAVLLIDAFNDIVAGAPDWDVCMLGSGPRHKTLQERINALGLGKRILLPGFAGNLGDWYRRADIYVMTSSFEGFPNTLLEALAHSVPSVAFDVLTGPRDLSDDGRRLMLLPDREHVTALAAALTSLISDKELRTKLGAAAAEVSITYSEDAVLSMWDELLASVVTSTDMPKSELGASSTK
jgi:GalNAc-alpha-(1->4)-GalNAc-alpha-(1->3)-diNAcBac-PP-undecaprenol alpha-1,4-N-acetyl-D-galactosaminyltransferase